MVSAAVEAARRTRPARLGFGRTVAEGITVNRRQRVEDGTILGWNPDEECDRDVAVIRVDDEAGGAICTVVAFASHPVVIGPDVPEASSDFVGPLRERVREWTGGECVFLQGCAGNIVPFESFYTEAGAERSFAERLALAALLARAEASLEPTAPEQMPFASAIPMAIWRHVQDGEQDVTLAASERRVALPLLEPPTLEEIKRLRAELEQRVVDLQAAGEPRTAWNPVVLHVRWAKAVEQRVADGTVERSVDVPVQSAADRPGMHHGLAVRAVLRARARGEGTFDRFVSRSRSATRTTSSATSRRAGNTRSEATSRSWPRGISAGSAPFAPEAGELLVQHSLELTAELFDPPPRGC